MKRDEYTVQAERDGQWWAIEVDGVENAYSQAKRLDQVEAMAREVVSLLLDVAEDSFDLRLEVRVPADWRNEIEELRAVQAELAEAERRAGAQLRNAAARLHDAGLPVRDVGALMNLSAQRISQLINDPAPAPAARAPAKRMPGAKRGGQNQVPIEIRRAV